MTVSAIEGETWLQGRSVVTGVAIGLVHFVPTESEPSNEEDTSQEIHPHNELCQFYAAVNRGQDELQTLSKKLNEDGFCSEADILDMHSVLIEDIIFQQEVSDLIQKDCKTARTAILIFLQKYRERFRHIPDVMMQRRFEDVESVCHRVMSHLPDRKSNSEPFGEKTVVFAQTASATFIYQAGIRQIKALVTKSGGAMSHTAIIAKAQGIPYVSGISLDVVPEPLHGRGVIVDGHAGLVILNPSTHTLDRYLSLKESHDELPKSTSIKPRLRARTKDGKRIFLYGNVASAQEACLLSNHGMDGIGLYRSEYLVLEKGLFPNEEEQSNIFAQIVKTSIGKRIVLRAFDFGDDKRWKDITSVIPNFKDDKRTVPLLLESPEIFLSHLRAMIRASTISPISILFPMVASIDEVSGCLALFHQACDELRIPLQKRPHIGVMIELPSMAFKIASLKHLVQFLSLGTNDLLSHTLAVDRSNSAIFELSLHYHTGFLHFINFIAQESRENSLPLCVCGEMASDPLLIPFLMGLDIHQLSISPRLAPMVKHVLRSYTADEATQVAADVLALSTTEEVDAYLKERYRQIHAT